MNSSSAKSQPVPHLPIKSLAKRLVAGVIALNLVVAGILWFSLYQSRLQYIDRAEVVAKNITQVLDGNISGIIEKTNIALHAVSDEAERQLAAGTIQKQSLNNYIIREHSRLPELIAFRATDASGDAVYGPVATPVKTTSLAQRDYFIFLRDTPHAGLTISKPLIGGISGKWMIVLARRINYPDGSFAGLVYAGISLDHLTKAFSAINVGTNGSLSLLDSDFTLVARYPEYKPESSRIGHKINSQQLHEFIQAGKSSGTYVTKSSTDSRERMYSYRKLSFSNPLYLFVGLATSDFLSSWHTDILKMSLFMVFFLLITTALTWQFYKALRRSKEAERAIVISEERFRNILQEIPAIAVQGYGPDGTTQYWNQASEKLYGYTAQEAIGRNLLDLIIPPEMHGDVEQAIRQMAATGQPIPTSELSLMRKDGSRVPVFSSHTIVQIPGQDQELFCLDIDLTEMKLAEEALKESNERYRLLSETMLQGVVYQDATGKIISMNPAAERILGQSKEEYLGCNSVMVGHKAIRENGEPFPGMEHPLMIALQTGQPVGDVIMGVFNPKRGEYRWICIGAVPVFRPGETSPSEVFAVFDDITERKLAEKTLMTIKDTLQEQFRELQLNQESLHDKNAELLSIEEMLRVQIEEYETNQKLLKESEERYKALHNATFGGIIIHDKGLILDCNQGLSDITGFTAEELVGMDGLKLIAPDWLDLVVQNIQRGYEQSYEVEGLRKDGSKYPLAIRGKNISYKGHNARVIEFRDITERKQAEDALRENQEIFSLFMKYSPIYTFIKQIEANQSRVIQLSDNFIDMVGRPAEELRGCTMSEIFPADFARKITDDDIRVVNEGKTIQLEEEFGDRSYITFKFPIASDSKHSFLAGFTIDITDRKKAEQEKLSLEQQLLQTQKLESLGVLAGGIAHDFNNLLAVIIGNCSLAKLRPIAAEEYIQSIETAAERAAALCQQMLAYAGKAHFTVSQTHLEELVDEMVTMSKSSIGKNVEIICDLASDIPPIMVDASQIRQVTMNLIINASEAIGASQGVVRVSLAKRAVSADHQENDHLGAIIPPGLYACLGVTDSGCGMDTETQRRLFEPFYTTKFTGRGLGMSAVLGIIKAHNGALQLFSQPGQGTTFNVFLPIQMTDSTEDQSLQLTTPTAPWQGSGTVLLVEDEESIRCVAEEMLEELGFKVIKASNGKEGMELYRQHAADISLTVTDIGMPVMDGYALTRELKSINPKLPIIISSGFGDMDVSEHIAPENIAGRISKPYSFDKMREVLKRVVEGRN